MLQRYIDYHTNFGRERCSSEADRLLEGFSVDGENRRAWETWLFVGQLVSGEWLAELTGTSFQFPVRAVWYGSYLTQFTLILSCLTCPRVSIAPVISFAFCEFGRHHVPIFASHVSPFQLGIKRIWYLPINRWMSARRVVQNQIPSSAKTKGLPTHQECLFLPTIIRLIRDPPHPRQRIVQRRSRFHITFNVVPLQVDLPLLIYFTTVAKTRSRGSGRMRTKDMVDWWPGVSELKRVWAQNLATSLRGSGAWRPKPASGSPHPSGWDQLSVRASMLTIPKPKIHAKFIKSPPPIVFCHFRRSMCSPKQARTSIRTYTNRPLTALSSLSLAFGASQAYDTWPLKEDCRIQCSC
jgi:hypothetical protein